MESIFDGHDDVDTQGPPQPSSSAVEQAEIRDEGVKADDGEEAQRRRSAEEPADDANAAVAPPSDHRAAAVRCCLMRGDGSCVLAV